MANQCEYANKIYCGRYKNFYIKCYTLAYFIKQLKKTTGKSRTVLGKILAFRAEAGFATSLIDIPINMHMATHILVMYTIHHKSTADIAEAVR